MFEDPVARFFDEPHWILLVVLAWTLIMFALAMPTGRGGDDATDREEKSVVVIDDDADVRRGLRSLIESRTPFRVRGEAHDGAEGVRVVDTVRPDLVIVDVKLPVVDGIEAARRIKDLDSSIPIVAFSAPEDDATGAIMRRAGASAHLVKGDDPSTIIETLMDFA